MRPKSDLPTIDHKVGEFWKELIFLGGRCFRFQGTAEEEFAWRESQQPRWRELLDMAYVDDEWLIQAGSAVAITIAFWINAIQLKDFAGAREQIERCMRHPGPMDPHDAVMLAVHLQVARVGECPSCDAATLLTQMIKTGGRSRCDYAFWTRDSLKQVAPYCDPTADVPADIRLLAVELARADRAPKEIRDACRKIASWGDLADALDQLWNWTSFKFNNRCEQRTSAKDLEHMWRASGAKDDSNSNPIE